MWHVVNGSIGVYSYIHKKKNSLLTARLELAKPSAHKTDALPTELREHFIYMWISYHHLREGHPRRSMSIKLCIYSYIIFIRIDNFRFATTGCYPFHILRMKREHAAAVDHL